MPSLNSNLPIAAETLGLLGGRDGKYTTTAKRSNAQMPVSVYNNTPLDTQTHRHTDRQTDRHTDTQMPVSVYNNTQTHRQTDTQMPVSVYNNTQTHMHATNKWSSSRSLSTAVHCRSYERAPCLSILRTMIGGCQTNVEW